MVSFTCEQTHNGQKVLKEHIFKKPKPTPLLPRKC